MKTETLPLLPNKDSCGFKSVANQDLLLYYYNSILL